MKFLVRQQLTADDDVFEHHLEPLADVVADSLDDPPKGPVVWLGGCGNVDTKHYYMLFEAPDETTLRDTVSVLPGLHSIERVMTIGPATVGQRLLRALADRHRRRQ